MGMSMLSASVDMLIDDAFVYVAVVEVALSLLSTRVAVNTTIYTEIQR